MKLLEYPDAATCRQMLARPAADFGPYRQQVLPILETVRAEGDRAVRRFSKQFDGFAADRFLVSDADWASIETLSPELRSAIELAYRNIRSFHAAQREAPLQVETMPGVLCSRRSVPIERVGLYVPGGSAPLFSTVLMLGTPAQLAGCREVVLCTPPDRQGCIHPAMLWAAQLCGIRQVYKIGGAQAIAAMAYGTEQVPQVWKIFGPGNPWVTAAKQLAALDGVAIDMPAGPSEVAVIADQSANPAFVAADLLSQAEHGPDSQVVVFSDSRTLLLAVQAEVARQSADLPRRDIALEALRHSRAVLTDSLETAIALCNDYAPEHLILQVEDPLRWAECVTNAGSVFLGPWTPESAGDYASGTNHTLPTGGYARAYAGVSLDSFIKKITFQQITPAGLLPLAPAIIEMARAEGLEAHARAVEVRQSQVESSPSSPVVPAARPGIVALKPYASARDEFKGQASIWLDANENSLGSPLPVHYHRYPNPPDRLRSLIADLKQVSADQVFLGNGSDEAIDLLIRAYCNPGRDNVVLLPPTYGMYAVQAEINGVEIRRAPLTVAFQPDLPAIAAATDANSKILFLCSPNNPSGNTMPVDAVLALLNDFPGLVVVDEAYIDFSDQPSWLSRLSQFPNLVVLQTLSKAWGLAGLRIGMAFAHPEIIGVLQKIKYPYNISTASALLAETALTAGFAAFEHHLNILKNERTRLAQALATLPLVQQVFPSDANFLLVRLPDADTWYQKLAAQGLVLRNRSRELHCADCLRITVGTPQENDRLLALLAGH